MKRSRGSDLSLVAWRKSSYSNGDGADCVEVADDDCGPARHQAGRLAAHRIP